MRGADANPVYVTTLLPGRAVARPDPPIFIGLCPWFDDSHAASCHTMDSGLHPQASALNRRPTTNGPSSSSRLQAASSPFGRTPASARCYCTLRTMDRSLWLPTIGRAARSKRGRIWCSVNAGAIRVLLPPARYGDTRRDARRRVLHPFARFLARPGGVEIMWENHTDSPYSLHLGTESFDMSRLNRQRIGNGS